MRQWLKAIRNWAEELVAKIRIRFSQDKIDGNDPLRPDKSQPLVRDLYDAITTIRNEKVLPASGEERVKRDLKKIHRQVMHIAHTHDVSNKDVWLDEIMEIDQIAYGSADYNLKMAIKIKHLLSQKAY